MPDACRLAGIARNLVLLARAAAHHAVEDPLLLAVQSARRLPRRLSTPVTRVLGLSAGRGAHTALTQARAAWRRGDITQAIELADAAPRGRRYLERLLAERAVLEAGSRLSAGEVSGRRVGPPVGGPRALHLLTNSLPHTTSGYTVRSHAVLRAQREAGITVEAVTRLGYPVTVGLPFARGVDDVDGVCYRRLLPSRLAGSPRERLEQTVAGVLTIAAGFEPTVLHTTTNYANALVAEAAARALGLPWVYEVRGRLEDTWVASLPPGHRTAAAASERYALLRAKETEMALAASHVVTLGETLREDLVGRGVPADRITVVPNAVDAALLDLRLSPVEARARLGLPADGLWVGTVGSLVDYEGLDTLLDAVALVRRDGVDVRVALVGDGVSRPALEAQAARAGLREVAVFPGRVSRDAAAIWVRALDVVVVPRRDLAVCRGVTPLKPIEAMGAGRPVIASDMPALAEVVARPRAGLLVPPGDAHALAQAIGSLAESPVDRMGYGENGHAFAATRTWAANGRLYRSIYDSLEAHR